MLIRTYREPDEQAVVALWQACGLTRPWNNPHTDIARKLAVQRELFLVGEFEGKLVATIMAGYEGHRGWVNYLAVAPLLRGRGFGAALMKAVEQRFTALGCPKLSLLVRSGNTAVLDFYRRLGYNIDDAVPLGKRLIADTPADSPADAPADTPADVRTGALVISSEAVISPDPVRLIPMHASSYRHLMLQAYALHPDAFTTSLAEREPLPLAWWERRLAPGDTTQEVVFGSFVDGDLAGVLGLSFDAREKARHKATLFGMYVAQRHRGLGIGLRLVERALACATSRPGVRLVQLTVTDGNRSAQALYERSGFVRFGLEPLAVAVGDNFVSKAHMWHRLKPSIPEESPDEDHR